MIIRGTLTKKHLTLLLATTMVIAGPPQAENSLRNPTFDSNSQFCSELGSVETLHPAVRALCAEELK